MEVMERLCIKRHTITDSNNFKEFTLLPGNKYTTSLVNEACAGHGPEPKQDHVTVFSTFWVSVPLSIFATPQGKE